MLVKQIYELMNNVTAEILGESGLITEDLSNVVDIGTQIFYSTKVDNYVKTLINHIGKVIFVNRAYAGNVPSVLRDGWEFGSILEKISAELPDATENESWELVDGASYDPNVFTKATVSATFFNSKTTFEIPLSITDRQVRESFSSSGQLSAFISMLFNEVEKSMTVKTDALIMRTINNMIAETVYSDFNGSPIGDASYTKSVNLLYLYNNRYSKSLTASNATTDPDFIRFASYTIGLYSKRMSRLSTLFNVNGKKRFTPADKLHIVMLADFASGANAYLQSDTFHNEFTALPMADIVPYWQGTGTDYAFDDISSVNVKTASNNTVEVSGILCVMFDYDALGVCNTDRRVTTNYNPKAEFTNSWFKADASYFNDLSENFVLFYVADATE